MLSLRCQLADGVHEAAVAGNRQYGALRIADLGAERGRERGTERALITGADKRARRVDRKPDGPEKGHLRQVVDGDCIIWERCANGARETCLRLEVVQLHRRGVFACA